MRKYPSFKVEVSYMRILKPNKGMCLYCNTMIQCGEDSIKIYRPTHTVGWYHFKCKPDHLKIKDDKVAVEEKKETASEYLARIGALS